MTAPNKYGVGNRLNLLESRCTALEAECKELRVHLKGALETAINDARRGFTEAAVGPQGRDGATGPKGERGDCTIPNDGEVAAALLAIRKKHARFLATIQEAMATNGQRKHGGLKLAVAAILAMIERELR